MKRGKVVYWREAKDNNVYAKKEEFLNKYHYEQYKKNLKNWRRKNEK